MTSPTTSPAPIAVIGIGCRFPGGIKSPEDLWEMLSEGHSGWSEIPADRWNAEAFYHPSQEARESLNAKSGYFLEQDIAAFDARFFKILTHEAQCMNPQQRILLETTYEALENAGISRESLKDSDTSVFVGHSSADYEGLNSQDLAHISRHHITGTGAAVFSNRISYVFDLKGASMSIDTGCVCLPLRPESKAFLTHQKVLIHITSLEAW